MSAGFREPVHGVARESSLLANDVAARFMSFDLFAHCTSVEIWTHERGFSDA